MSAAFPELLGWTPPVMTREEAIDVVSRTVITDEPRTAASASGVACDYYKLNDYAGAKVFRTRDVCDHSAAQQHRMWAHGCAPKVLTLPTCIGMGVGRHRAGDQYNASIARSGRFFAYLTEHAKVPYEIYSEGGDIDLEEVQALARLVRRVAGIGAEQSIDLHDGNYARLGNRLVLIDFDGLPDSPRRLGRAY